VEADLDETITVETDNGDIKIIGATKRFMS